jgi:hypothetical protein
MAAQVTPAVVVPPAVAVPNPMGFVLLLCGITDQQAHIRLIDFEGLGTVEEFGDYTDDKIADMAKRNEMRTPENTRIHLGIWRICQCSESNGDRQWSIARSRPRSDRQSCDRWNWVSPCDVGALERSMKTAQAGA